MYEVKQRPYLYYILFTYTCKIDLFDAYECLNIACFMFWDQFAL